MGRREAGREEGGPLTSLNRSVEQRLVRHHIVNRESVVSTICVRIFCEYFFFFLLLSSLHLRSRRGHPPAVPRLGPPPDPSFV